MSEISAVSIGLSKDVTLFCLPGGCQVLVFKTWYQSLVDDEAGWKCQTRSHQSMHAPASTLLLSTDSGSRARLRLHA